VNVVDSSGWIEYLSGGGNARFFRKPLEGDEPVLVPTLCLVEVYRHMLRHIGREEALEVVAAMRGGVVFELDDRIALEAAELSVETKLWTQDSDVDGMEGVRSAAPGGSAFRRSGPPIPIEERPAFRAEVGR
jgi:hypothetical protein